MKNTVVRKENYGLLVFVPSKASYYRIYDEKMADCIIEGTLTRNFDKFKKSFAKEYDLLCINEPIFIDNSKIESNVFVPLEAYFDYTSICNRACEYCYNKSYLNNVTMKPEMVRKVINDFADLGIMRVHLAGGEPTIDYEGLKNYIEECKKRNIVLSMATNGSLLSDDICELLTTNDLLSVSISIDSANEEKNDLLRGKESYQLIKEGLERLIKHKTKNNSAVELCFKPVYYPNITEDEIMSLINLSKEVGIQKLKFANPERCLEHEKGYYGKIKEAYYKTALLISKCAKQADGIQITNITNPFVHNFIIGIEENKGCIGAQELITINPDGRITPCLMNHYILGNIYDYKNLKQFLEESIRLKDYRKIIKNYDCNCIQHESCRGGCQVRKIVEYGSIESIDPLCPKELLKGKETEKKLMRKVNVYHSL